MSYFKIGENDYSYIVNQLKISTDTNYNAQTNANGDTVVDFINKKRTIEVGIIHLDDTVMSKLLNDIDDFSVSISFRNPKTNLLEENVACIVPSDEIDYYTIQVGRVSYNAFTLTFIEL